MREAELSMLLRVGTSERYIVIVQGNVAGSYQKLGKHENVVALRRDIYSRKLRIFGAEHEVTVREAKNYAISLASLERFGEARTLLHEVIPVAQRVQGEGHDLTLRMKKMYAQVLYARPDATLDDLREAVSTLEEVERIARRVFGSAHPLVSDIEGDLQNARATLQAREHSL